MAYSFLVGVVYTLAIARLTRLINADTLLDRPRGWIAGRVRETTLLISEAEAANTYAPNRMEIAKRALRRWNTLFYFVQCPWCVGMWLALGSAWIPLWFNTNVVARYLGIALAISHLVGVFAFAANTEDVDYEDETVQ